MNTRYGKSFNVSMTRIAKANQVSQGVCFTGIFKPKESERANVVNVERTAQLAFVNFAELALVSIPSPSFAGLSQPVGAIVMGVTAKPHRVSISAPVRGLPCTKARTVAKRHFVVFCRVPRGARNIASAMETRDNNSPCVSGRILSNKSAYVCSSHTRPRTVVNRPLPVPDGAMKHAPALRAFEFARLPLIAIRRHMKARSDFLISGIGVSAPRSGVFMWHERIITNGVDYTGIGSEGYVSIEMGRKFVGSELKRSYWELATRNLRDARETQASGLFAMEDLEAA